MPATTDFDFVDCPFAFPDGLTFTPAGPADVRQQIAMNGADGTRTELAIDIFGTDASLVTYQVASFTVDGGALQSVSGSNFFSAQLFSGLSDTWHRVVIYNPLYVLTAAAISVTSDTTPALRAPGWYGTGYSVVDHETHLGLPAGWWDETAYHALRTYYWTVSFTARLSGAATGLRLFGTGALNFDIYVDGVFNSSSSIAFSLGSGVSWTSQDVITGLAPGEKTIKIVITNSFADAYVHNVFAIGGTLDLTYTPTYPETIAMAGDSITMNSSSDHPGPASAIVAFLAANKAYFAANLGKGGTQVPVDDRVPNGILRRPPRYLLVYFMTNNLSDGPALTTTKLTTFLQSLLDGTSLHAGLVNTLTTKVIVFSALQWLYDQDADWSDVATDAVAALTLGGSSPAVVVYTTTTDTAGAFHPSSAHNEAIAGESGLLALIAPGPLTATPDTAERTQTGQTTTLDADGIDLDAAVAGDFTLTGCTITGYDQSTHVLTFTAATTTGAKTLTHTATGASTTITVEACATSYTFDASGPHQTHHSDTVALTASPDGKHFPVGTTITLSDSLGGEYSKVCSVGGEDVHRYGVRPLTTGNHVISLSSNVSLGIHIPQTVTVTEGAAAAGAGGLSETPDSVGMRALLPGML